MPTVREARKFTNIPGIDDKEGYEFIPDLDVGGDYAEQLPGEGTYSVVGPSGRESFSIEQQALTDFDRREDFKRVVYDQIGGNPNDISEDKALKEFEMRDGYKGLFNHVFSGHLNWIDRNRMTPEQKIYWNQAVTRERAAIAGREVQKKQELTAKYNDMMGQFDRQFKMAEAARKETRKEIKAKAKAEAKAKKAAEKARVKARKISPAKLKAYRTETAGWDGRQFIDEKEKPVEISQIDLEIINKTSKEARQGEFVPVPRVDPETGILPAIGEFTGLWERGEVTTDTYFQLPLIEDDNLEAIAESAREIQEISKTDEAAGQILREALDGRVRENLAPESIASLAEMIKTAAPPEAPEAPEGEAPTLAVSMEALRNEFRAAQQSGNQAQKLAFTEKIKGLPAETQKQFMAGTRQKPRGTIKTPTKTVIAPLTESEQRRKGYAQRTKSRQGRRERTLQKAQ